MGTHVWFGSIHLPKAGVSVPERQKKKKQVCACLRETRSVSAPDRENNHVSLSLPSEAMSLRQLPIENPAAAAQPKLERARRSYMLGTSSRFLVIKWSNKSLITPLYYYLLLHFITSKASILSPRSECQDGANKLSSSTSSCACQDGANKL